MRCKAKSKTTGEQCKLNALPGKKVCRYHGGMSNGAPKGSKNALKTGIKETITRETMSEEENKYADSVSIDPVDLIQEQLRILKVKELRISRRIAAALDGEAKAGTLDQNGHKCPSTVPLTLAITKTKNFAGLESSTMVSNSETFAQNYLRLEQAHNAVLHQIAKTASLLAQLKADSGAGEEPLPLFTCPPEKKARSRG